MDALVEANESAARWNGLRFKDKAFIPTALIVCMKSITKPAPNIPAESVFSKLDDGEKNRFHMLKITLENIRHGLSLRFKESSHDRYVLDELVGEVTKASDPIWDRPKSDLLTGTGQYSRWPERESAATHFLYYEMKRISVLWDTPLINADFVYVLKDGKRPSVILSMAVNLRELSILRTGDFSRVPYDNICLFDIEEHSRLEGTD